MWKDMPVYREDLDGIIADKNIEWKKLDGKTVLVTGATGLIGSNVVNALLYYGEESDNPPRVVALVRNQEKARHIYEKQLATCGSRISFIVGDIRESKKYEGNIDYIVHAASETASVNFIKRPVETIQTAFLGTQNMLELAREKRVRAFLYLSSMEAYGFPATEQLLTEDAPAYFSSSAIRSSYPEGKRVSEMLTAAYVSEYGVPACSVRLAQTFGPGISRDDGRVFADFALKAIRGKDIVLVTPGNSARMYLYTADAVRAILTVLLKGKPGECYNAANEVTYCSIIEMARMVAAVFSRGKSDVRFSVDADAARKYSPVHNLKLDTTKLKSLGWKASVDLEQMYSRMIEAMEAGQST